jgi:hypothetical protein
MEKLSPQPALPFDASGGRKHRKVLLWLVVLCGVTAFVLLILGGDSPKQRPKINRESYSLIREGMTELQVAELLGGPPGNYATRPTLIPLHGVGAWTSGVGVVRCEVWQSDDGLVAVSFNEEATVLYASYYGNLATRPSSLLKIPA